jgi:hypothetical protein
MEFFLVLLLGSAMVIVNLGIQVWAISWILRAYEKRDPDRVHDHSMRRLTVVLSVMMLFLFLGHILQFGTWALLFWSVGEFEHFATAFYHSAVNFTSLGYGDIVMSEDWRLLGALEAANGVLMFGLTAGLVLSVMNKRLLNREANRQT